MWIFDHSLAPRDHRNMPDVIIPRPETSGSDSVLAQTESNIAQPSPDTYSEYTRLALRAQLQTRLGCAPDAEIVRAAASKEARKNL